MASSPPTPDVSSQRGFETHAQDEVIIEVLDALGDIRTLATGQHHRSILDGERGLDLHWLEAVCVGLDHQPYLLVAKQQQRIVGLLPLALVKSWLFGRYLVSLPYVNTAGVNAINDTVAGLLVDRAVALADSLNVRHLELRHESELQHPGLSDTLSTKVHMRLALPATSDELWDQFKSKVRNKVSKGDRQGFTIQWGADELLPGFYEVFSHTMRDLGTPVFCASYSAQSCRYLTERPNCALSVVATDLLPPRYWCMDSDRRWYPAPHRFTNSTRLMSTTGCTGNCCSERSSGVNASSTLDAARPTAIPLLSKRSGERSRKRRFGSTTRDKGA